MIAALKCMQWEALLRIVLAVLVLVGFWVPANAQDFQSESVDLREDVEFVPIPEWVHVLPVPSPSETQLTSATSGTFDLLLDRQTKWHPGGYSYYQRSTELITDRSGLEMAGQVLRTFDPATMSLDFSFIRVIRDGQEQNHAEDTKITLIRQEDELDLGVIDGNVTAFVLLQDIQVGDIIDVAVSGEVSLPLWPEHRFESWRTNFNVPLARNHFRLLWPSDKPFYSARRATDIEPVVTQLGDLSEYVIDIEHSEAIEPENGTPVWYQVNGSIDFSTMNSWSEVSEWAVPLYEGFEDLPEDFLRKLDEIAAKWPEPEDRLTEALRLVQDQIRYVAIAIGPGSFIPREPAEVLRLGYGDCKDKSQLLVASLRHLGIDAWPALTHIEQGPSLPERLPSIIAFDHVIVKAVSAGQVYWLDPTQSHQGGRGTTISLPDYGYALPIAEGQIELEVIDPLIGSELTRLTNERFIFPADGDVAMRLEVETHFLSYEADGLRYGLAVTSTENVEKTYIDFYQETYPGLTTVHPPEFSDDLDANLIVVHEAYEMRRETFDDAEFDTGLPLKAFSIRNLLHQPGHEQRQTPLEIPYGLRREHVIQIEAPGRSYSQQDTFHQEAPGVQFSRSIESNGDSQALTFTLATVQRSVGAIEAGQIHELAVTVNEMTNLTHKLPAIQKTIAEQLDLSVDDLIEASIDLQAMVDAIDASDRVETLQTLNSLVESPDLPSHIIGLLHQLRAELLDRLDRKRAARAAYEEGIELFPYLPEAYFSLADVYTDLDDYAGAARTLRRLAEKHPDAAKRLRDTYFSSLDRELVLAKHRDERFELTRALVDAGYKAEDQTGSWDGMYTTLIEGFVERERMDEARELIDRISSPGVLASLMVDREYELLWPALEEHAGKDLSRAIEKNFKNIEEAFNSNPQDREVAIEYVQALGDVGKFELAVEVAAPYVADLAKVEAIGQEAFWFVNAYAYALRAAGDNASAYEVMSDLVDLDISSHPSLVGMSINMIEFFEHDGRFEEALASANKLAGLDENFANDFGWMWIYETQACALHQLGRAEDSAQVLQVMSEKRAGNPAAYTKALLCMNRLDQAEEYVISRLTDRDPTDTILMTFLRPKESPTSGTFLAELVRRADLVKRRQAVQDALIVVGREIQIDGFTNFWASF